MRRWVETVLLMGLATVLFLVVTRPSQGGEPTGPPVLLDADAHGVLVRVGGEVVGVDSSGEVRWRDRSLAARRHVSCLAQCPDAVGSGGDTVIWRSARDRVEERSSAVVLWARSRDDALVARDGLLRVGRLSYVVGDEPRLFTDDARAVLVSGSSYRLLSRGTGGWTVAPPVRGVVDAVCFGPAGPVFSTLRCAIGADLQVVQRFEHGRTVTRGMDLAGGVRWERVDTGRHVARVDPATGMVALPTDGDVVLLDRWGTPLSRFPGVVDARFVGPGRLVMARLDGRVIAHG